MKSASISPAARSSAVGHAAQGSNCPLKRMKRAGLAKRRISFPLNGSIREDAGPPLRRKATTAPRGLPCCEAEPSTARDLAGRDRGAPGAAFSKSRRTVMRHHPRETHQPGSGSELTLDV